MNRYHRLMPVTKQMSIRLSAVQRAQLRKLAAKLHIDQSNVIRLAIARLAEAEGVTRTAS